MRYLIIFGCVAILASHAIPCHAGFVMMLEDTDGNSVTIDDNGAGDESGAVGVIVFNGSLGGDTTWTINVATGISKPILGPDADMDLNSVNVATDGPGTLILSLTDTDYTSVANASFGLQFEVGGTNSSDGTLLGEFWGDDSNSEFGMGEMLGTLGPFGDGAFSGTGSAVWSSLDGIFSLTQMITLVHTASGRTSFNVNLTVPGNPDLQEIVPEPASMSIMFLGSLLAGFGLRRRKENRIKLQA